MKYITATELAQIIDFNRNTIHTYLAGYRFSRFRLINAECMQTRFLLNKDFITVLYSFLWHKRKREAAKKLKEHFQDFDIKLIPLEEFVK